LEIASASPRQAPERVRPIRVILQSALIAAVTGAVRDEIAGPRMDHSLLEFAEDLVGAIPPNSQEGMRALTSDAHLMRARQLAGSGRASFLSLVHLDRARELRSGAADAEVADVRRLAEASFAAAGPMILRVQIDTNPQAEPLLQDLLL